MNIEEGKFYKTRDGKTVGPMRRGVPGDGEKYWISDDSLGLYVSAWFEDGSFWPAGHACKNANNAKLDLILPAYPEQGTLKEIGAKPGDLVEFVEWEDGNDEHGAFAIGKHYTHTGNRLESGIGYFMIRDAGGHIFRIISRASETPTSPVRTVTTTRQEIVPGVYGAVSVHALTSGEDDGVWIAFTSKEAAGAETYHARLNRDELTAAINTLTEIRDAITA